MQSLHALLFYCTINITEETRPDTKNTRKEGAKQLPPVIFELTTIASQDPVV